MPPYSTSPNGLKVIQRVGSFAKSSSEANEIIFKSGGCNFKVFHLFLLGNSNQKNLIRFVWTFRIMCNKMTKSTRKQKEEWHSIRVKGETYRKLVSAKGLFELQTGKVFSMDKTIDVILETAPKTKVAIAVDKGEEE